MTPFPEAEIANLQKHGWIQVCWNQYESNPEWIFAQVYVLPNDIARDVVPRTSNALRKALKAIMASLDRSPAAWNGEFEITSAEESAGAADDESLWYIFNTLDNPMPDIEDVKDANGRLAMQELMASSREANAQTRESSGVIGLKTPLHPYQCRSAATMIQREVHPKPMLDPRLQAYKTPYGQEYYYDKEEGILLREKRLYDEACGGKKLDSSICAVLTIVVQFIDFNLQVFLQRLWVAGKP